MWLKFYRFGFLKDYEQGFFDKAVSDLVAKGILRPIDGKQPGLGLTQKGFNPIPGR